MQGQGYIYIQGKMCKNIYDATIYVMCSDYRIMQKRDFSAMKYLFDYFVLM